MKKQQGTCTTGFFSGHNLSRKEKVKTERQKQYKTPKKFKASHFAVETVGISMDVSWLSFEEGDKRPRVPHREGYFLLRKNHRRKIKRLAGAQTSASSEKGRVVGWGVFQVFSAVENSEKQK